eukprot:m.274527 g.274527  ORF g.274527 m.274527 type:complete len:708 (+) comp54834_c0_seq2:22-2145(+)
MSQSRSKRRVTYLIRERDVEERHRFGVSAVRTTDNHLLTAGRDGTIRLWAVTQSGTRFLHAFEGHADWINDMLVLEDCRAIVTASSDTTVRVWQFNTKAQFAPERPAQHSPHHIFSDHTDYVQALSYSKATKTLVSGGCDGLLIFWDLSACSPTADWARHMAFPAVIFSDTLESIYSLAISESGNICLVGCADRSLIVIDVATKAKIGALKGHTENVKALAINANGTLALSGSSDHTIKLWDISSFRCTKTFEHHADSVWALCVDPSFKFFLSGGRDRMVFLSEVDMNPDTECSLLMAAEEDPILDIAFSDQLADMWVATTSSAVRNWSLGDAISTFKSRKAAIDQSTEDVAPFTTTPKRVIEGAAGIVQASLLSSKLRALTRNTVNEVVLWDIVACSKINNFGQVSFDEKLQELNTVQAVPSWCSVDFKTGSLAVHLDEHDAFAAWAYAHIFGVTKESDELKVNIGGAVLQALFVKSIEESHYRDYHNRGLLHKTRDETMAKIRQDLLSLSLVHDYFVMPPTTPIFITSVTETKQFLAHFYQCAPLPVEDAYAYLPNFALQLITAKSCIFGDKALSPPKIAFEVVPDTKAAVKDRLPPLSRPLLTVPSIMPLAKIAEYVVGIMATEWGAQYKNITIDFIFDGQVIGPAVDVATVKQMYWKRAEKFELQYRTRALDPVPASHPVPASQPVPATVPKSPDPNPALASV